VLCREEQREERVVRTFERVDAVVADLLEVPRHLGHVEQPRRFQSAVDQHHDSSLLNWIFGGAAAT